MLAPLTVQGMHGLGDNLHQRGVLRELMLRHDVTLESSWVSPYHDLIAAGLKITRKATFLRTQTKNANREASLFVPTPGRHIRAARIWYSHADLRKYGTFFAAMCATSGVDYFKADFRLPVPPAWHERAAMRLSQWRPDRPLLIYRPLVDRPKDWSGCRARNPDFAAYRTLFAAIREQFFVVSVADLAPGYEWQVSLPIDADVECHAGELEVETLAALMAQSALVYCSPGFAVIMAQAVGTPVACIFGGHESAKYYDHGGRFGPYLGINPKIPCDCFSQNHACKKEIDIDHASANLKAFAHAALNRAIAA